MNLKPVILGADGLCWAWLPVKRKVNVARMSKGKERCDENAGSDMVGWNGINTQLGVFAREW